MSAEFNNYLWICFVLKVSFIQFLTYISWLLYKSNEFLER